ncbi:MAG: hypothetical protein ACE5EF_09345 [Dehalococcoidia bacterium]
MDNDFSVDLAEVASTIGSADVVVVRFMTAPKRLLLDFRTSEVDGPYVGVVEPVRSVKERYKDLRRLRPRFELPERIHVIWWPRYVESLRSTGIWDRLQQRIASTGHVPEVAGADKALAELLSLEAGLALDAIKGDGFRTLWSATPGAG